MGWRPLVGALATLFAIVLASVLINGARTGGAASDNAIRILDSANRVGEHSSIALDTSGNPVISYYDRSAFALKVMHCNDPNCAGNDENIATPDRVGLVGQYTSLILDAAGNPVVSYYDITNSALKVLHCGNPNCTSGNTIATPDTIGDVGKYSSIELDGVGKPVVSYYDETNADLKLLHCGNTTCTSINFLVIADAGQFSGVGGVQFTGIGRQR